MTQNNIMGYGWKFLTPWMTTIYNGVETGYPSPAPGKKWSEWMTHPEPSEPDGEDCGKGRYHVMNKPSADYAPRQWWIWFVQYRGVIGQSNEKVGVRELRLCRVPALSFWHMIRQGKCKDLCLNHAYLSYANLSGAYLSHANLSHADLRGADLRGADLRGADLSYADLRGANLSHADLRRADLRHAYLSDADLGYADLRGADLRRANLSGAYLSYANLRGANLRGANLSGADLRGAYLRDADIRGAYLRNVVFNADTIFPKNFDYKRLEE